MSIELTSTAFPPGMTIPKQYTGDGVDQSPPLRWSEPPAGTKSIALVCDDPDAPRGTWVHWVLFNLPPETRELEENVPEAVNAVLVRRRRDEMHIGTKSDSKISQADGSDGRFVAPIRRDDQDHK